VFRYSVGMKTKLCVLDFDGTLFRSPLDTEENRRLYEQHHGIPWMIDKKLSVELSRKHGKQIGMRRGWWGRAETLSPPLVPCPAPMDWFIEEAVAALRTAKEDESCIAVIMTGRHKSMKNEVFRILDEGDLVEMETKTSSSGETYRSVADANVDVLLLGMDGPRPRGVKPHETFPWKVWIMDQYLEVYDSIESVEIWEDRVEHVQKFQLLADRFGVPVTVNHVVETV
jgi:hypothetical protein